MFFVAIPVGHKDYAINTAWQHLLVTLSCTSCHENGVFESSKIYQLFAGFVADLRSCSM